LEPFTATTVEVALQNPNTGEGTGFINVRMLFRPEFLNRARAATSTFSGATRVGTGLVGAGKGVVGGGASAVGGVGKFAGKGFSSAAYRVGHGGHGRKSSVATTNGNGSIDGFVPPLPDGTQVASISQLEGSLKVVVLAAHAGDEKAHVTLKHDGKAVDRSHDAFTGEFPLIGEAQCLPSAQ
jgi:hypothetical protein